MGELSKSDARKKREDYISQLESIIALVQEDFAEMDFENARQRDKVEEHINNIVNIFNNYISMLEDMDFE